MKTLGLRFCGVAAMGAVLLAGSHAALAEATYTVVNGNYVFNLSSDDTYSGVLSGSAGLVKQGSGKLTLTGANTFTGQISIEGGTLAATTPACFGKPSSISVGAGAVFDITPESSSDATAGSINVDITLGANATIRRSSGGAINSNIIKSLILQGDATLDMGVRFRISSFVLNGYKLTKLGGADWVCSNSSGSINAADAGGRVASVQVDGGSVVFQNAFRLVGSPANKIIWNTAGRLYFYDQAGYGLDWPIEALQTVHMQCTHASSAAQNIWCGPVLGNKDFRIEGGGQNVNMRLTNDVLICSQIKQWGSGGIAEVCNTGVLTNNGAVVANGSVLRFTGKGEKVFKANWYLNEEKRDKDVTLELLNAGDAVFPAAKWVYFYGKNLTHPTTMTISNTVFRFPASTDGQLRLGCSQNGMNILEIQGGSVITSQVRMAESGGDGSRNAVYMSGGFLTGPSGSNYISTDNATGAAGYFELSGGTVTRNRLIMGRGGTGFYHQKGGTLSGTDDSILSQGGRGTLRMSGGTMQLANLVVGSSGTDGKFASAPNGGRSLVALSGAGTELRASYVTMARTNAFTSVLAVNDGAAFVPARIRKTVEAKASIHRPAFHISFNGGILKPSKSYDLFDTANHSMDPDTFIIHPGGIVVDTSATRGTSGNPELSEMWMPMGSPSGKVVASIALPSEAANATTYCGPATVTINGAGRGAAAVAEFDSATRRITGITVVSPGTGYDDATTATIESPDGSTTYSCTVTMADAAATGGLTKRGSQVLRLRGANTYGGPTSCEEGDLVFQSNGAYPGGDLELAGGVITFAVGSDVSLSCTVRGSCAALFGGNTRITCDHALNLSNVTFEVTDPENLQLYLNSPKVTVFTASSITGMPALAADYGPYRLHASGNTIRFGGERGTTILFR